MEAQPKVSGDLDNRSMSESKHLEHLNTPQISYKLKLHRFLVGSLNKLMTFELLP